MKMVINTVTVRMAHFNMRGFYSYNFLGWDEKRRVGIKIENKHGDGMVHWEPASYSLRMSNLQTTML
ncbi:MAG: hypothetical protein ACP5I3_11510 [Thermoproteus sp.]